MIDAQLVAGALMSFLTVLILLLCVRGWMRAWEHQKRGMPLLCVEHTAPPPVTFFDLLALFIAQIAAESWAVSKIGLKDATALSDLSDQQQLSFLFYLNISRLTVFALGSAALYLKYRRTFARGSIGLWLRDLGTGALAFCMIAPLVYGIQIYLSLIWKPSQHPIISLLQESENRYAALAICGVAAVVAAPLFEELVFRRLLHGWLDRVAATKPDDWVSLFFETRHRGQVSDAAASNEENIDADVAADVDATTPGPWSDAEAVDNSAQEHAKVDMPAPPSAAVRDLPMWPMYVSSAIFALLHLNGGPDPIPLFFFALWLAYLYRLTGRITPCIVVHLLLNLFTFALLAIEVLFGSGG